MNRASPLPWLSLHVFLADPVQSERYLRDCLAPAIARWRADQVLERWFFIRYWEGGPHLRVRLAGPIAHDGQHAMAMLAEPIAGFRAQHPPTREAYYSGHVFDGQPVVEDELPWYPDGSVVNIGYQPELLRYGGQYAIDASEQLFELSSRLALSVCKATGNNQDARLSSAFVLMAAAVLACGEGLPGVATFFAQYGSLWTSSVGRAVQDTAAQPSQDQMRLLFRLEQEAQAGWTGNSAHAVWAAGVRQLAERLRALHAEGRLNLPFDGRTSVGEEMCRNSVLGIVGSQIHMLNNRLGIPPAGEFLLARLLVAGATTLNQPGATI